MERKTLIIKLLAIAGCTAAILLMNYAIFRLYVANKLDLAVTWIAAHDIQPRTRITADDLVEVRISRRYLLDHTYNDKSDIIGKYTEIQGMIPAGSPFYAGMLYEEKDLPDQPVLQLKENQVLFTLEVDVAKIGSITAGQRADIFVTAAPRDETPVTGCLIRNARVVSIKDHKGVPLSSKESTGIPYMAELAVGKEQLELLTLAKSAGEIQLYTSSQSYSTEAEAQLDEDSPVTAWLRALKNPPQAQG